jgi:hypothetical protein
MKLNLGLLGGGGEGGGGFGGMHANVCFSFFFFFPPLLFQDNKTSKRRKTYKIVTPQHLWRGGLFFTPRGCSSERIVVALIVYQTFSVLFNPTNGERGGGGGREKKKKKKLNSMWC